MSQQQNLAFSVDSHLLRELGALLVGRDSTALLELIKNSYDADATLVLVDATDLGDGTGSFTIVDNGNGMTLKTFKDAFLRIAGRAKEGGDRLSPTYRRRFTGAKGIGRLSAHKLAATLEVNSVPRLELTSAEPEDAVGVLAELNWDRVEEATSDLTQTSSALTARALELTGGDTPGTSMRLVGIRGAWDRKRIGPFIDEIRACRPPTLLTTPLDPAVTSEPLLFEAPKTREHGPDDPGFTLELTGELAGSDELWLSLGEKASWILEIDATPSGVHYAVAPTTRTVANAKHPVESSWFSLKRFTMPHPDPEAGPFFQARVLMREGSLGSGQTALARFERRESGIRIFLEGFRVLPYGAPNDDWLALDQDYVRKRRVFRNEFEADLPSVENEGFVQVGNRSYYGAVFLTEQGAPRLQAVVNREGFIPDAYFMSLTELVRTGIDLITRTRAAINRREKEAKDQAEAERKQRRLREAEAAVAATRQAHDGASDDDQGPNQDGPPGPAAHPGAPGFTGSNSSDPDREGREESELSDPGGQHTGEEDAGGGAAETAVQELLASVASLASDLRADPQLRTGSASLELLSSQVGELERRLGLIGDEQLRLRTLASVGTQFGSFVHEINGLLGQAETLRSVIEEFPGAHDLDRLQRHSLRVIRDTADELTLALTRQASYLTEVLGADARRRRRRLPVQSRVDSALKLLLPRIVERGQQVANEVDPDVSTPPLFPAELAIIVTNLVSNATKFAGPDGKIRIDSYLDEAMRLHLVVENTGTPVAQEDWDRYFRPFESTTTDVDIVLGQGMGLGLPIVRSVAEEYNGEAHFSSPSDGYATAVEVVIPDPRPSKARRQHAS